MSDASSAAAPGPAGILLVSGRPEVVVTGGCWAPAHKFPTVGTRCWSPAAWLTGWMVAADGSMRAVDR